MRVIEYQAFLHDEKTIVDVVAMNLAEKYIQYYDVSHCKNGAEAFEFIRENPPNADCPFERCNLREFTDEIDRYNRKIHEGDIVYQEFHDGRTGGFVGVVKKYEGAWWIDNNINNAVRLWSEMNVNEVIGNIYSSSITLPGGKNESIQSFCKR